jgi:hypothetical protein
MMFQYETCGKVFVTKKEAVRFARNIANACGKPVWVWETISEAQSELFVHPGQGAAKITPESARK